MLRGSAFLRFAPTLPFLALRIGFPNVDAALCGRSPDGPTSIRFLPAQNISTKSLTVAFGKDSSQTSRSPKLYQTIDFVWKPASPTYNWHREKRSPGVGNAWCMERVVILLS